MSILSFLGGALKPITGLIDDMHTSTEEKMIAKAALMKLENEITITVLELERQLVESKASIIVAEAQSESWITRTWRPLTMLTFVVLIVLISTGLMDVDSLRAVPDRLWTLMQIGIGGYLTSRGAEKIVPGVVAAMKKKEEV